MSLNAKALAELAAFKQRQIESERQEAQRRAEIARRAEEQEYFARAVASTVGRITPLRAGDAAHLPRPRPAPHPRQRLADEAQALASSLSDDMDTTTLMDTDDSLSYCRSGIGADVLPRLRRGQWAIQGQLDLHGLTRDAAREALAMFIRQAARDGLRCVRVVHGKGNGSPGREPVLKHKVRTWLVQKAEVMAFAQASAADGGHGAVLVLLG